MPQASPTPLESVRIAFSKLIECDAVTLDGCALSTGLPDRRLNLRELAGILLDNNVDYSTKDAIWAEVVRRARFTGQPWLLVALGLMIKGLRSAAQRVWTKHGGDIADIESMILIGFIEAAAMVDTSMSGLSRFLRESAYQRANNSHQRPFEVVEQPGEIRAVPLVSHQMHIDIFLARAIDLDVLTMIEVELIARTRIEKRGLLDVAKEFGISYDTALALRQTAESRLKTYLLRRITQGPEEA